MANAEKKSVNQPDETRTADKAKMDLVNLGGGSVGRATFEPGWRWSEHMKPTVKTELCEVNHFGYTLSGRAMIRMADGSEFETSPGDVVVVPAGHDAWVIGDEPWVVLDWAGAAGYARPA